MFKEAYEQKQVPPSFRTSHVVLIPKSEDPEKLLAVDAYRPISLMNVDYKIFTKVLGKRLQGVVTRIVGSHQTCGIKGRSIYTNIHIARSILEYCNDLGEHCAMLQLDMQKAFDRVAHKILFSILEHIKVGDLILDGVKMCYQDCTASLIINKEVTKTFSVRSSVRQGVVCRLFYSQFT